MRTSFDGITKQNFETVYAFTFGGKNSRISASIISHRLRPAFALARIMKVLLRKAQAVPGVI